MDHKWLEDFIVLARERSFSRAAALRHVTQPQFSRRIRALELWAGAELVDRSCVPLSLTPAGETMLGASRAAIKELGDARMRIGGADHGGSAWLTVATGRTLSRTVVPGWLAKVRPAVGDFRLRLITGSIHEGAVALEQGGADLLLCFSHTRLTLALDEQQFEGRTLAHDELIAVSSPAPNGMPLHPLPGTRACPARLLNYAPSLALGRILQDGLAKSRREMHLQTAMECDFADSLREHVLQGAGVAWLPHALVAADLVSGRLVRADLVEEPIRFAIRLYCRRTSRSDLVQRVWAASQ